MPRVDSSATPRTDALIARVIADYPTDHLAPRSVKAALAKYYEAVHQELAPLCRELEAENLALRDRLCHPTLRKDRGAAHE
ncbi:hypothetical protein [Massilia sp. TSP1-1-2]|uniref:hypothetical protein n=1 Tax=Massilia sp. TSP1-1-2 TaxID=2804649 RepID=UPI003CEADFE9